MRMLAGLILARRNLRKRFGQLSVLFLLLTLTSGLIYSALLVIFTYGSHFDRLATETKAQSAYRVVWPEQADVAENSIAQDARVQGHELVAAKGGRGSIRFGSHDFDGLILLQDRDEEAQFGHPRKVREAPTSYESPVWVPLSFETQGGYELGDEIKVDFSEREYVFQIQGFVEVVHGGSGSFFLWIGGEQFRQLEGLTELRIVQAVGADSIEVDRALEEALDGAGLAWNNLQDVKENLLIGARLVAALMVGLAVLLVGISFVLARFVMKSLVLEDSAAIGVLRASGYTSGMVMRQLSFSYVLLAFVAAVAGMLGSIALFGRLESLLSSQSGLNWKGAIVPWLVGVVLLSTVVIFAFTAMGAAIGLRRVGVVELLRGRGRLNVRRWRGGSRLSRSLLPLSMAMGFRMARQHVAQNIVVGVTAVTLSFSAAFILCLATGVSDRENVLNRINGDLPDVRMALNESVDMADIQKSVLSMSGVSNVLLTHSEVQETDSGRILFQVTEDPGDYRFNPVYEGDLPREADEIVVGHGLAAKEGLRPGDIHTVSLGGVTSNYRVTGIATGMRFAGVFVILTGDAYRRLQPEFQYSSLSVYLVDPAESGKYIGELSNVFKEKIRTLIDVRSGIEVELSTYLDRLPALVFGMVILAMFMVALVIVLIVSAMISKLRLELGVKKALGFTQGNLMKQVEFAFLPVVFGSTLLGTGLAVVLASPLFEFLLGLTGIRGFPLNPPVPWIALLGAGICGFAWLVTWAVGQRMRGIVPRELLTE